ncbi:hypothetical protein D3C80_897120 [compost metagenome]
MDNAAFGCNAGIPRDNLDATLRSFLERRHNSIRIVGRDSNCIYALSDQRIDDFDLAFSCGCCRAGIDDLNATQFLGRFLCTFIGSFKKAITKRFCNKCDLHIGSLSSCRHEGNGQRCAHCQFLEKFHVLFLPIKNIKIDKSGSGDFSGFPPFATLTDIGRNLSYDELNACIFDHPPRLIRNAVIGDQCADTVERTENETGATDEFR